MSGSAGGNRIPRSAVEKTVQEYIDKVLSKVPGFKSAKISGSYNTSAKQDFGDIDLITSFEGEDKKEFKKQLTKYLESLPDDVIVPFKSEKYTGKKTMNTGEIVTILYPITGIPDEFVQIDNIISLSEEEGEFKKTFLDYPAEIQGLILGLVKVVTLEEDPNKVITKMGIKNIPALEPNQEYEFNLSSAGLTLRIVTLGEDYKQLERTDVWKSSNWEDVKKLLSAYNIDQPFKDLVSDLKKLKNPRSKNRIKGLFKSMVSIKSGEVNTPKGDNKQIALDTVAALEEKYGSFTVKLITPLLEVESGQQSIAVFPGAFKPPHASHLKAIQVIAPKVDKVYVYVSKQPRVKEGQTPINADQAMAVWDLYKQKGLIPDNVEIKLATNTTPVLDAYQEIEAHPKNRYLAVFGKDEEDRWKSIEKNREKYGHVTPFNIGNLKGLSASDLRTALKNKDVQAIQTFLPKGVTAKEYIQALTGQKKLQEIVTDTEVICDNCGWSWSIKDGGDNLYVCHECGHDSTPESKETWNLQKGIVSLTKYMVDNGMNISPLPKLKVIDNDKENADKLLGYTAHYNPGTKCITLYTLNRHPKDVLRSYAHEMVHHMQNLENRLGDVNTTNTNEDGALPDIEREAYEKGNMMLRNWEDNIKSQKYLKEYKQYALKELFEKDLPNIEKINQKSYIVGNGNDIEAKFYFNLEIPEKDIWSVYWFFTKNNTNTSPEAWKQVTATSFKVLDDFLKNTHPKSIHISGNTEAKTKLYKNYIDKLQTILNNKYEIDNSDEDKVVLRSIEEIAQSSIKKRIETLNESYEQALNYWQNGDVNSKSKIERWNSIKKKIQREVLQELYNIKEEQTQYKIYCDMDGVIADFDKRFEQFTSMSPREYEDRYGVSEFWDVISKEGVKFWVGIPWMPKGKELWNYIKKYNPTLLSAPSRESESRLGKRLWVKNHIPGTKLILATRANKQNYAEPDAILIDDRPDTISEWNARGGKGILFISTEQTINELKKLGL